MTRVLVVDDSAVDRRLVSGLLKQDSNVQVEVAENGNEAIDRLRNTQIDLVVTDLQMPELDGLGLVRHLREDGPHVPVILITAHGSEELALEALREGAASYVPKSELAQTLQNEVEEVLALTRTNRSYERLSQCQTRAEFTFRLENDTDLIDPLVELVQQVASSMGLCDTTSKLRIGMALRQALANSMLHGNLELDAEQIQDAREAMMTGQRSPIVEHQHDPRYRDRRVEVDVAMDSERLRVVIRDEGPGFDVRQFEQNGNPDAELKRGRGIRLMRMFMNELAYNDRGNEVTMVKYRDKAAPR